MGHDAPVGLSGARHEGRDDVDGEAVGRARGLRRVFGATVALDGVDVDLPHGVTGLVGPNGAGKTTLIGLLLGLDRPDDGTVELLGRDPTTAGPAVRARVGYAPEYDPLPPDVRAQDLVRLVGELHGLDAHTALERASDVLQRLGLGEERLREIGTLSTGQKQRVKLAQAIVHDPALVLLDEPTDGLDPLQRAEMLDLVVGLATEQSLDVLVSSHLLADLERICDHLVVLRGGRVVDQREVGVVEDTPEVLLETVRPAEPVRARLAAAGVSVRLAGRTTLVLDGGDVTVLDAARDAVAELDVGLRSLAPRRVSLEDVVVGELAEAPGDGGAP
jgi:ABC-2 type transport system ATP-binding protein